MNDRLLARITASLDQKRAAASDIGEKETVSEMELLVLTNMATVGLFYLLSVDDDESIGPEQMKELMEALGETVDAIRCEFARPGGARNGVVGMINVGTAMLVGDRFRQFFMRAK